MPSTYQSIVVQAPIDQVWSRVRDFHDMSWAPNVIESCEAEGETYGDMVGARRVLNGAFHETLIEHDDKQHRLRYSIDDGPSPVSRAEVSNYVGTLHVLPVTYDDTTFVEWYSQWEADTDDACSFCHEIYTGLLEDLATTCAQANKETDFQEGSGI